MQYWKEGESLVLFFKSHVTITLRHPVRLYAAAAGSNKVEKSTHDDDDEKRRQKNCPSCLRQFCHNQTG
jgi:hypothetical protein